MNNFELLNKCLESPNGIFLRENVFSELYKDTYELISHISFPEEFTFRQKLYHYLHDDYDLKLGLCPTCGKRCKFLSITRGYSAHCSKKCAAVSDDVKSLRKNTNIKKYGNSCSLHGIEIAKKTKKTNLLKYGVEYPTQCEKVREKIKKTVLEKYEVEHISKSELIKNEKKKTFQKNYGVDYSFMSSEVKSHIRDTCMKRYGFFNPASSDIVKEKVKQTNIEKYGVENVFASEKIKEKIRQTNLDKYGVEYAVQNDNVKNKIRQTTSDRYGVEYPLQSEDIKEKVKQTNLDRYGVEWYCMTKDARNYSNDSKPNKDFANLLDENNIKYEREFPLEHYSYDFKVDNILIEINPTITHNSYLNIFGGKPKDKNYHLDKTKCAKKHGYQCIHIWDWDDIDKIVNELKPKTVLLAKDLKIMKIDEITVNRFLYNFDLDGCYESNAVCYGLFLNETLVQVMLFHKNCENIYEIVRFCTHNDYQVINGFAKLVDFFQGTHVHENIIFFCDISKNINSLTSIKLELTSIVQPKLHWVNPSTKQHVKSTSISENKMLSDGFLPIYDCGVFVFNVKK